jgi:hypothetical protein
MGVGTIVEATQIIALACGTPNGACGHGGGCRPGDRAAAGVSSAAPPGGNAGARPMRRRGAGSGPSVVDIGDGSSTPSAVSTDRSRRGTARSRRRVVRPGVTLNPSDTGYG